MILPVSILIVQNPPNKTPDAKNPKNDAREAVDAGKSLVSCELWHHRRVRQNSDYNGKSPGGERGDALYKIVEQGTIKDRKRCIALIAFLVVISYY